MISLGTKKLTLRSLAASMAFLMLFVNAPLPARAQDFDDDDIEQTVARISYISGPVSYGRGDDPDGWDPAITTCPSLWETESIPRTGARSCSFPAAISSASGGRVI